MAARAVGDERGIPPEDLHLELAGGDVNWHLAPQQSDDFRLDVGTPGTAEFHELVVKEFSDAPGLSNSRHKQRLFELAQVLNEAFLFRHMRSGVCAGNSAGYRGGDHPRIAEQSQAVLRLAPCE